MIDQLTKAEQEFMEIFKRYSVKKDEVLLGGHIFTGIYKDQLLSVPNRDKHPEIKESLIKKGYAYVKDDPNNLFLTEKGEKYIYG